MNKNTKKIVIVAMLVAFDVIFSRLLAFNVLIAKVGSALPPPPCAPCSTGRCGPVCALRWPT